MQISLNSILIVLAITLAMLVFVNAFTQAKRTRNLTGFTKLHWFFTDSETLGASIWSMSSIGMFASSFVRKTINLRELFHYASLRSLFVGKNKKVLSKMYLLNCSFIVAGNRLFPEQMLHLTLPIIFCLAKMAISIYLS